jgi:hypothetical protein
MHTNRLKVAQIMKNENEKFYLHNLIGREKIVEKKYE